MGRLASIGPLVAPRAERVAPPVKLADPFYLTREWRALASAIKRQRRYTCEACGLDGRKQPWRMHADHIIEIRDGGAPMDPLNVQVLCHACHNAKTAKAKAARLGLGR